MKKLSAIVCVTFGLGCLQSNAGESLAEITCRMQTILFKIERPNYNSFEYSRHSSRAVGSGVCSFVIEFSHQSDFCPSEIIRGSFKHLEITSVIEEKRCRGQGTNSESDLGL